MALPITVVAESVASIGLQAPTRPFISTGGNCYILLVDTTDVSKLIAYKASDPTSSWASVGTDPDFTTTFDQYAVYQDGDDIHVAWHGDTEVKHTTFDMSTDTWASITTVASSLVLGASTGCIAVSTRDDGDIIIAYTGADHTGHGSSVAELYYARWEGSSWTAGIRLDDNGTTFDRAVGPLCIKGSSDRMHMVWASYNSDEMEQRVLDSSNSLLTVTTVISLTDWGNGHYLGASYDDAGTTRVRCCGKQSNSDDIRSCKWDSADTPTHTDEAATTDLDEIISSNDRFHAQMANDETDLYIVYDAKENAVDEQVRWVNNDDDGGWSAFTKVISVTTGTDPRSGCNIYQRGDDVVLATIWKDGTNVKYDEHVIRTITAATEAEDELTLLGCGGGG